MARKKEKDLLTGRIAPNKFNLSKLSECREMFGQFDAMQFVERHMPLGMTKSELHRQMGLERHFLSAHRSEGEIELAMLTSISNVTGVNMLDFVTQDLPDWMLENRLTRSLREELKRERESNLNQRNTLKASESQTANYRDLLRARLGGE